VQALFRNCIAAGLFLLPVIPASADDGKPRYVSGAGADRGDCLNKFRPCRTLSYAISQAGKGDIIAVAEGSYELNTSQELTDLLTVQGRVAAGYDRHTGFTDRIATDKTVLVGVPPELRERFERDGFTVIVDTKSLFETAEERTERDRKNTLASKVRAAEQQHKAAPCTNNVSDGFACQNVSLHAHVPLDQLRPSSGRGNDVWGFVDLNTGREYAFMGLENGVAVIEVTNPTAPEQVAFATGSTTTWRDIKVYQLYDSAAKRWRAYAYATADSVQDFLMVLDLSNLPNGVERVNFSSEFRAAHNAYLLNTDYTFGLAQRNEIPRLGVSGSSLGTPRGSHRLYSLTQPRSPALASISTAGYSHDLASYAMSDARKSSQCVNATTASACEVVADFNENTVDIWDVTNPGAPQMLVSQPYANAAYTHSGWWSEDGRYLYVHDELDEQNLGLSTTVRVFDMANLRAPALAGTWTGPTRAIDHNGYVRGNRYYISNYSEGLTVLDTTNPTAPQRIGYFDTYPTGSPTSFVGAWGVYPFFASGTIAVGDINTGLYLLKNEALQSANGTLAFAARIVPGTEGQQVALTATRTGGASGAVSAQIDLLYGTAAASDVSMLSPTVSWTANDAQPKTVLLNLTADAQTEDMELLLARLKNPQGGATVNYPDTAYVYVTEAGATNKLRLVEPSVSVDEVRGKALVTVSRVGSLAGTAQVSYRTVPNNAYSGFTASQGDLTWADGEADAKIMSIALDPSVLTSGQTGSFQVEFYGAANAALETSGGSLAAALVATINVVGEGSAPTPVPPTLTPPIGGGASNNRGGGGALSFWWLAMLLALVAVATRQAWRVTGGNKISAPP
jgi:choice-of-anchor B domain-containing protein